MPIQLTVNGVTYNYPKLGDENWGQDATNWAVGITQLVNSIQTILNNTVLSGIFEFGDGSAITPTGRFQNSLSTGFYRVSADVFGFTAAGVAAGQISSSGLLQWKDGSAAAPAFSFSADPNTGMYRIGADQLGFATNGTLALSIDSTQTVTASAALIASTSVKAPFFFVNGITATLGALRLANNDYIAWRNSTNSGDGFIRYTSSNAFEVSDTFIPQTSAINSLGTGSKRWQDIFAARDTYTSRGLFGDGTNALPSISFESDVDTGLYHISSNTLGFVTGSTIMGSISNSGVWTIGASSGLETHVINGFQLQLVNSTSTPVTVGFLRSGIINDNQVSPALVFQFATSGSNAIIVHYSLVRGSNREIGTVHLLHNGTTADLEVENRPLGECGVLFTADISGGFVRLLYTSTNTGSTGTIKFTTMRWDH